MLKEHTEYSVACPERIGEQVHELFDKLFMLLVLLMFVCRCRSTDKEPLVTLIKVAANPGRGI